MSRSEGLTTLRMIVLHLGDVIVADLQPRAAGHAHVDNKLAGVGARESRRGPGTGRAPQHQRHAAQNRRRRKARPPHRPLGKALVPAQHALILLR